jgi:hypothetical protein
MTAHTPYAMTVVGGISATQFEDWKATNEAGQLAKGNTVFGGHMMIPIMSRDQVSSQTIELTKMPENYNEPEEIEQAAIEYSLSLGVAKTDLKPLTGRMAGTATQTEVIDSQSDSSGLGLFSGEFEDFVNDRVCRPPSPTSGLSIRPTPKRPRPKSPAPISTGPHLLCKWACRRIRLSTGWWTRMCWTPNTSRVMMPLRPKSSPRMISLTW